jgi:hypothetical protein
MSQGTTLEPRHMPTHGHIGDDDGLFGSLRRNEGILVVFVVYLFPKVDSSPCRCGLAFGLAVYFLIYCRIVMLSHRKPRTISFIALDCMVVPCFFNADALILDGHIFTMDRLSSLADWAPS